MTIMSKPRAHLQTINKTSATFQIGLTKSSEELRSQSTHSLHLQMDGQKDVCMGILTYGN